MNIADKCVCINLKSRKDKKKYMKILCRRRNIPIKYYLAEKHENPRRGCLESHLNVIQKAIDQGHKSVLILEDDVKFIRPLSQLHAPPKDWDMLYLGGTVQGLGAISYNSCIVNLQNPELIESIMKQRGSRN